MKRLLLLLVLGATSPLVLAQNETAFTRLADGFDFPVGRPNAEEYYKSRGFRANGHLGEDWNHVTGGNTDLRDPVFCIGDGVVVLAKDARMGWGNVVIVRHSYREGREIKHIDSLYGHLDKIMVTRGRAVKRGEQIGTIGTAHGRYAAHLHFEIRKNIEIGMSRSSFRRDQSNYFDPTSFITARRSLPTAASRFPIVLNTFNHDKIEEADAHDTLPASVTEVAQAPSKIRVGMAKRLTAETIPVERERKISDAPKVTSVRGKRTRTYEIEQWGDRR